MKKLLLLCLLFVSIVEARVPDRDSFKPTEEEIIAVMIIDLCNQKSSSSDLNYRCLQRYRKCIYKKKAEYKKPLYIKMFIQCVSEHEK